MKEIRISLTFWYEKLLKAVVENTEGQVKKKSKAIPVTGREGP
jgi:hypothetical protein